MNEHEEITQQRHEVPEHLRCRHVFIDGHRCGGYALRNEDYCYFHHETRKPAPNPQARYARRNSIALPKPTSRANIQEAVGKVLTYLAFNDIDTRRAGLLLYALQIATLNLNQHNHEKQEKQEKEESQESAARSPEPDHQQPATDNSFHEDAFAIPPSPLSRPIMAALLDDLAKYHGVGPSPGSPEDRKPTTNETVLPTLQAVSTAPKIRVPHRRRGFIAPKVGHSRNARSRIDRAALAATEAVPLDKTDFSAPLQPLILLALLTWGLRPGWYMSRLRRFPTQRPLPYQMTLTSYALKWRSAVRMGSDSLIAWAMSRRSNGSPW